jgi:TolB-like protein
MTKASCFYITFILLCTSAWAGGEAEGAGSSTLGRYLAGKGIILTKDQVHINSYIASIDYNYPASDDPIGLSIFAGNNQITNLGQDTVVHIGIQGNDIEFAELPPLNLAFVIDKSGSMNLEGKIDWVKKSFEVFINRVRDKDYVALVVFDGSTHRLFPSTQMNSEAKRIEFLNTVRDIRAGGGTNLLAGLRLGYEELSANYKSTYTNRVLLLSDGVGESEGLTELAELYREKGINVSVIGVGSDFDVNLMVDLAKKGGGSSRFIGSEEEMKKTFGTDLARMVVPVARDLRMELELFLGASVIETWGYNHQIRDNVANYSQNTMHLGDYETILVHVNIPATQILGKRQLCRFTVRYKNVSGEDIVTEPVVFEIDLVDKDKPVTGYSNAMALQSGTMMAFGKALIEIADLYYSEPGDSSPAATEDDVANNLKNALDIAVETKKQLENTRLRLDNEAFDDEIEMMSKYIEILGQELELEQELVERMNQDTEIEPELESRSLSEYVSGLFKEIGLYFENKKNKTIALTDFVTHDSGIELTLDYLNDTALSELSKIPSISIIEKKKTADALGAYGLDSLDLVDTGNAISIGKHLQVDYILTGVVINMSRSMVIFSRIIDAASEKIESTAQVIVHKTQDN